jgi:hypothetical protein
MKIVEPFTSVVLIVIGDDLTSRFSSLSGAMSF